MGFAFTVSIAVTEQVVESVYVMIEVPGEMPVAIPEEAPMVATAVLPLVHVPPEGVEFSVVVWPTQTVNGPVIAVGSGLTVIV